MQDKLTSANLLPHRKYRNKLICSRRELPAWAESQTHIKADHSEAVLVIAKRRAGNGNYYRTGSAFQNYNLLVIFQAALLRNATKIDSLKAQNETLVQRVENKETAIEHLKMDHRTKIEQMKQVHSIELASKQDEIDRITFWFPDVP